MSDKLFERIETIKKFLFENPALKHEECATMLTLAGYPLTGRTVYEYRCRYQIPYHGNHLIKAAFEKDLREGHTFSKAEEIMLRYNVCKSYARILLKIANGTNKTRIRITKEEAKKPQELPPVKVNTMAHLISQLTAGKG